MPANLSGSFPPVFGQEVFLLKKFIVSISAVICLVISNLAILPVGAAVAPSVSSRFASTEFIQEHYGFFGDYFSYGYTQVNDYGDWYVEYSTVEYFDFSDSTIKLITKENNNGIYTFETNYPVSLYRVTTTYRSTDPDNIDIGYQQTGAHYTKFVYDSINDKIYLNDEQLFVDPSLQYKYILFDIAGINNNPDNLDVRVTFSPRLDGEVDRSFIMPDGNKGYASSLTMFVENHSSCPIQYQMSIYKANQVNLRPTIDDDRSKDSVVYDDDPVFIYFSKNWVYTRDTTNQFTDAMALPMKVNKASSFHYLAASSSETVTFNYNQINLTEGVEYKVVVKAVRNEIGIISEIFYNNENNDTFGDNDLKMIDSSSIKTVYESNFKMLQYSDVNYDSSATSNGVLSYNGANGITDLFDYNLSYDAKENDDGTIDYESVNKYSDQNSWFNNMGTGGSIYYPSGSSGSSGSVYNNLVAQSSSIFGFFSSFLNLFPFEFRLIFNIGFWSIIIIAIVKKVF